MLELVLTTRGRVVATYSLSQLCKRGRGGGGGAYTNIYVKDRLALTFLTLPKVNRPEIGGGGR